MAEGLTQQQIDELLGNVQSGEIDIDTIDSVESKKVKDYDFRSPKKITKDQLKFLENIYDNFSRFFNIKLASLLRVGSQIEIQEIEEEVYKEYNNALDDSVLVGIFEIECPDAVLTDNQIIIQIARPLSFSMIDLLLGGDGSGYKIDREYTEVEINIMQYVYKLMLSNLNSVWSGYINLKHTFSKVETNSRLIQFIEPEVSMALISMKMTLNEVEGDINICIPASIIETLAPLLDAKNSKSVKKDDGTIESQYEMIFNSIKKSSLDVKGILGSTDIELQDLLVLRRGDIVVLDDRKKKDSVHVKIEDNEWFNGELGRQKKNYAIKVHDIIKNS